MTQNEIRATVESKFDAEYTTTPVAYENVGFAPPDEGHWVRLAVQPSASTLGGVSECGEVAGFISVQVFSPLNVGTKIQDDIVAEVTKIFSGTHSGVTFEDASLVPAGESGGWYRFNIFVGFTARGE